MPDVEYFHPVFGRRDADYDEVVRILDRTMQALMGLVHDVTDWHVEQSDAGQFPEVDGWPDVPQFIWTAYLCRPDIEDAKAILGAIQTAQRDGPGAISEAGDG